MVILSQRDYVKVLENIHGKWEYNSISREVILSEVSKWSPRIGTMPHRKVEKYTGISATGWNVMRST